MTLNDTQFLGLEKKYCSFSLAKFVLLPVPYEGAVSYGKGAAQAPQAVLDASLYLELYDEVLKSESFKAFIGAMKVLGEIVSAKVIHTSQIEDL